MLKPTSNFKMKKQTKRFMATFVDPVQRAQFKKMMIDAQLQSEVKTKTSKNDRED